MTNPNTTLASSLWLLALLASADMGAQPERRLEKPNAEHSAALTQILSVREMRDGRVIVSDPREKTLQVLDFAKGASTPVSREGAGPNEWMAPGRLLAMLGDSTAMLDPAASRILVLGPDGQAVRTFAPAPGTLQVGGSTSVQTSGGALGATAYDSHGRVYYRAPSYSFGASGLVMADSAAIIRYDLASGKSDTAAFVNVSKSGQATATARGGASFQAISARPFSPADDWTVLPDGRVAVIRVADYHVEIVGGQSRQVGTPVAYTPVRVTDADKEEFRSSLRQTRPAMSVNGQAVSVPPPPEPQTWPDLKPPFIGSSSWAVGENEVWVVRAKGAAEPNARADVFNDQGQPVGRVLLPAKTRIVGVGSKAIYLARVDDDGLQYLQRYSLK